MDWESVPLVRSPLWREHLIRGQNHEAESAVQKFSSVAPNGSLDCGRCRPGLSGCCIEGNKVPACVASCMCVCVACVTILHTHTHTQRNAVKRWKAACEGEHVTCVAWRACVLFCGGAGERPTRSCLRGNREGAGPAFGGRCPSREPYRRSSSLCLGEGQVSEAGGRAGEPGIAQSGVERVTPLRLRCDIQILSIAP